MELSENDISSLMGEVRKTLHKYSGLEDYDDLLSESYLAAWETGRKMSEEQRPQLYPWGCEAGHRAAQHFLRSNRRLRPFHAAIRRSGKEPPIQVSYETLRESWAGNDEFEGHYHATVPDFAPRLIQKWYAAAFIREVLDLCTPKQKCFIQRVVLAEETLETVAESVGLKKSTIHDHIQRGLDQYRYQVGAPVKKSGTLKKKQRNEH